MILTKGILRNTWGRDRSNIFDMLEMNIEYNDIETRIEYFSNRDKNCNPERTSYSSYSHINGREFTSITLGNNCIRL